jgi:hypothetical protein
LKSVDLFGLIVFIFWISLSIYIYLYGLFFLLEYNIHTNVDQKMKKNYFLGLASLISLLHLIKSKKSLLHLKNSLQKKKKKKKERTYTQTLYI